MFTPQGGEVARQFLPFSALESQDPEDLWRWLGDVNRRTGAQFISIPHNANLSAGRMFPLQRTNGQPVDAAYARMRQQWEPVLEVTQIKGDSETHPMLSPTDEFAGYETYNFVMTVERKTPDPTDADYARSGLRRGLSLHGQLGVNPYKFGMIGSSDSHTGMSAVEETRLRRQELPRRLPRDTQRAGGLGAAKGWDMGAAGFVAVWADGEHAQGDLRGLPAHARSTRRRDRASRCASSAASISSKADLEAKDLSAATATARACRWAGTSRSRRPTRADLPGRVRMKDPQGANLDRVQIVKGWLARTAATRERVYDVAGPATGAIGADGRSADAGRQHRRSRHRARTATTSGRRNSRVSWRDPHFDPVAARVLLRTSARDSDAALFAARLDRPRQALAGDTAVPRRSRSAPTARRSGTRRRDRNSYRRVEVFAIHPQSDVDQTTPGQSGEQRKPSGNRLRNSTQADSIQGARGGTGLNPPPPQAGAAAARCDHSLRITPAVPAQSSDRRMFSATAAFHAKPECSRADGGDSPLIVAGVTVGRRV